MQSVKVEITPGKTVSRVEVIIRIIYTIIVGIILAIFGIIVGILWVVNFLTCLILAKRVGANFMIAYLKQMTCLYTYAYFVTDERPPLLPEV